jgi:hypothetical protein
MLFLRGAESILPLDKLPYALALNTHSTTYNSLLKQESFL